MAVVYEFKPRTQPVKKTQTVRRAVKIRWKHLFLALTILAVFIYGSVHLVSNAFQSVFEVVRNFVQEQQEKGIQKSLQKYEQVEVVVNDGDTAWEIQKRLTPNEDVRIPLYLAEKLNPGVKMGKLYPGQKIIMLKSKE